MNMGSEIIYRNEAEEIKELKGWILIYGRRKVGKTFLLKNFLDYDAYFRIKRDGKILADRFVLNEISNVDDLSRIIKDMLDQDKKIIIDEFQRVPEGVLEEIASVHPKGKIIFCGSSMRIIKEIVGRRSPLLGLVLQYRLGLVKPGNILRELLKVVKAEQAVELAPYLSDIWTIPFFRQKNNSLEVIYELLRYSKFTIPSLIGEVFTEEERKLTRTYESIIRLMGAGKWDYREIAGILAGRGLISSADTSLVLPYIKNLVEMGIVEALPLYSSKKKMYRLVSPIMEAFYYLDDRYDFREVDVSLKETGPTLERLRNLAIQNWFANLFAEIHQGRKEYFVTREREIDFIITSRKKPVVVGEVKWGKYSKSDIKNFKEKTRHIKAEKVFITKKKTIEDDEIKIIGVEDIIGMV
jgi:uncharacterized protein